MKTSVKRLTAVIMTVILCLSGFQCLAAAAVSYPAGITAEDALAAIPKTEKLLLTMLKQNEQTANLSGTVYGMLYSDKTLNQIFSSVYSSISENADTMSTLGIDVSTKGVGAALAAYPEISESLINAVSWDEALNLSTGFKWGVDSRDKLSAAVAAMLSPFNDLLYTLLCSADYKVGALITVKGANGYQNAVVPIFKALCCKGIISDSYFASSAAADRSSMIKNIMKMLYSVIDGVIAAPVASMCKILPAVAYFMDNDGLSNAIETLISPLQIRIAYIFTISGVSDLIDSAAMLENSGSLTSMLEDIDLGELTGTDVDINLAELDLSEFAKCGTVTNGVFTADEAAGYVTLLRWLINTVKENNSLLASFIGDDAAAGIDELLGNFMNKNTDDLVAMIIRLLTVKANDSVLQYTWSYAPFTATQIEYTPNLTKENYIKVLNEIDPTLNEFLVEFGDTGSLSDLISTNIYSNTLVSTLVKELYSALYTEETAAIMSAAGLDVSPKGIASAIKNSYPTAAKVLSAADNWDKVNASSLTWGFYNGNRAGFKSALTAVLSPFAPFLRLLLAEGSYNLMDAITVYGSNGYNTAIIPLLEALGCPSDTIKSYSQYKASADTSSVITDILEPVLALTDQIIEKPVYTLCSILPNVMYFMNGNGIKTCVDNLLYPVSKLLDTVGMSELLPSEIENLSGLDISSLVKSFISSDTLPFTLPEPNLNAVASLGTAVTKTSKRTVNGSFAEMTYIEADTSAVLITVLRYVFGALGSEENSEALSGLMSGNAMGDNSMMSMYAGNITKQLEGLTTDETIEWFYNLLFAETPKTEIINPENETAPTVIYTPKEEDNSLTKLIVGIALATLALVGIIIFIAKSDRNAADEKRERRKRKKLEKAAEKAAAKTKSGKDINKSDSSEQKTELHKNLVARAEKKAVIAEQKKLSKQQKIAKGIAGNDAGKQKKVEKKLIKQQKKAKKNVGKDIIQQRKSEKKLHDKQRKQTLKELRNNRRQMKKIQKQESAQGRNK